MVSAEEFLVAQMKTLHRIQYTLSLASSAAASHRLKSELLGQLSELEQMDTRYQILSTQRGWEIRDMEPADRWQLALRFHYRKDPKIAHYLINMYTQDCIGLLKLYNRLESDDATVRRYFQKFMDQCTVGIRQMQYFL